MGGQEGSTQPGMCYTHQDAHLGHYFAFVSLQGDGWHEPAIPALHIHTRDDTLLHRLGRVRKVNDCQTNEDHPPKRVLPGGNPDVPDDHILQFSVLSAGYRARHEED